jgi:hypothetical protein
MSPVPGETGRRESPLANIAPAVRRPGSPDHQGAAAIDRPSSIHTARALIATASSAGSGFGSKASSMRRAIVSIVCGVFADGVERAVFAPAGDVRDRLAADLEADGAQHAVRRVLN